MKRTLVLISVAALVAMVGCKKAAVPNDEDVLGHIFGASMSAYSATMSDTSRPTPAGTEHLTADYYYNGPAGGYIHVIGDMSVTMNFDETGHFLNGIVMFQFTEVVNGFAYEDSAGQNWTLNGAPNVSITGDFGLWPDGAYGIRFSPASHMTVSGAYRVTGPGGYDHTASISLTNNINSTGTGGHVSGSVDGKPIDYYY